MILLEHYMKFYKYKVCEWDNKLQDYTMTKDMNEKELNFFSSIEPKLNELIKLQNEINALSNKFYKNNSFELECAMNEPHSIDNKELIWDRKKEEYVG